MITFTLVTKKGSLQYYFHENSGNPNIVGGQKWHDDLAAESFLANNSALKNWQVYDDHSGSVDNPTYLGDEELNKVNTLNRMNNGKSGIGKFHLVSHYDHGGAFGIGVSGQMKHNSIYREDMDALTNGDYLQIMYTTACKPGTFTLDAFAEHYINNENGGGVAILANSATVGTGGYQQDVKLFQSIYGQGDYELSPNSYIMGIAATNAKNGVNSQHYIKLLTLFGDPSMATWSATPQDISLSVPSSVTIDPTIDNALTVNIGAMTEPATITLYKYNAQYDFIEVFAKQEIDPGNTSTEFILNPDTEGELLVTATAKNYLPATATVNIAMPDPHLYITGYTFTDENSNGVMEQGEDITLSISITNSGGTAINNIHTVLSGVPELVTITNAGVNHSSSVAPGATIQLSGYTFIMGTENGTIEFPDFIEFKLDITGSGNYEHLDNFYLEQNSAVLNLGARAVTDSSGQPVTEDFPLNQSLNLDVKISNTGNVASGELNAVLTSSIADVTTGTSTYANISAGSEGTNASHFVFELSTQEETLPFTLTLTNALGQSWEFDFDLNETLPPLITGFDFTSTTTQINLSWDPISGIGGYNIYRSDSEEGDYVKMNEFLITGSAVYTDYEVDEETSYFYKISVVTLSGNELSLEEVVTQDDPPKQGYLAWTSLDTHGGFPVTPGISNRGVSSPTLYDVDGNGTKEIFLNYRESDNEHGIIMGFEHDGQELFNIDGNETTVSGFAETDIAMLPNSAVGDIDGDGHAEVLSVGRFDSGGAGQGKLFVYKTVDEDEPQTEGAGLPDPFWEDEDIDFGYRVYRNPVLYDLDNDGYLEIMVIDERQKLYVYDKDKNIMPGWPKQLSGQSQDWSMGEIAVADLDNDGFGEIAIGVLNTENGNSGIYIYNHDGTDFTTNPFYEFSSNERGDGGITFADIDNDGAFELLTVTKTGSTGHIYAFKLDGNPVDDWDGDWTFQISNGQYQGQVMPRISVGDVNNDGMLEVAFGSKNNLYVLDKNGDDLPGFPILNIGDIKDYTPILADIDGDADIEIIVNCGGKIYAFNTDGTECVGWRLESSNGSPFMGSPAIDDIDNDGLNEVVISTYDCATYVWDTDGDADRIEWGLHRADSYNTGAYKHGCLGDMDLYIGDNSNDIGIEPNPTDQNMWSSPNIWVRNDNDGGLEHQNPEYNGNGDPNYINVRVVNRGCDPTTGTETLTLNWAKANTSLSYPDYWVETTTNDDGFPLGEELDPVTIPVIQPGEETIVTIPWVVPNPDNYMNGLGSENPWHFCLLATILSDDDPLSSPYTSNPNVMVRENNNQAWRNVTVVDLVPGKPIGGSVAITNPSSASGSFDLLFNADDRETGKLIFEEAEVSIKLDSVLYNAWVAGGRQLSSGIHQNASSLNNPVFYITSNNAKLKNLVLAGNQMGLMAVRFNMLTKELTSKPVYNYFVTQIDHTSSEIIGGETYEIRKPPRAKFYAEADDITADKNETVTLVAEDIDENAVYNWYDEDDNLIYSGTELTVVADIAKTYKLEIIADADGYKDYTEVEVELNPNTLNGIVPNPANSVMTVDYNLNGPTSAYLSILGYVGNDTGVERNYILDTESSDKTIDVSSYAIGFYNIRLICDGEVVGTLNLIKE